MPAVKIKVQCLECGKKVQCLECGKKFSCGPNSDPQCPTCGGADIDVR